MAKDEVSGEKMVAKSPRRAGRKLSERKPAKALRPPRAISEKPAAALYPALTLVPTLPSPFKLTAGLEKDMDEIKKLLAELKKRKQEHDRQKRLEDFDPEDLPPAA